MGTNKETKVIQKIDEKKILIIEVEFVLKEKLTLFQIERRGNQVRATSIKNFPLFW
jgi:hypothetical protein